MIFVTVDFGTPLYDEVIYLRDLILRKPLSLSFTVDQISNEYKDFHYACLDNNWNILGTLLMKDLSEGLVKMRQVAVSANHQRMGIGQFMVAQVEKDLKRKGYNTITLAARDEAVPFYKKLDYKIEGSPFVEVGIPHRTMVKKI